MLDGVDAKERKKFSKQLDAFESPAQFATRYRELQKRFDGAVNIPGDDADNAVKAEFAEKIGWVSDAAEYKKGFERPEFATELMGEGAAEIESEFFDAMHAAHMPKSMAQAAAGQYYAMLEAAETAKEQRGVEMSKATEAALREEYGESYGENLTYATRYAESVGVADLADIQLADGGSIGDLPVIMKALVAAGRATLAEDGVSNTMMSDDKRQTLEDEWNAIHANPKFNSDKALQRREKELSAKLHGTTPADGRV
jgi:hypothetical protein